MVDVAVPSAERQWDPSVDAAGPVPAPVLEFCEREGCTDELHLALDLLSRHFPQAQPVLGITCDPESGEEWVSIRFWFSGETAEFRGRFRRYIREWVDVTRWPQRDKVRLSYGIR